MVAAAVWAWKLTLKGSRSWARCPPFCRRSSGPRFAWRGSASFSAGLSPLRCSDCWKRFRWPKSSRLKRGQARHRPAVLKRVVGQFGRQHVSVFSRFRIADCRHHQHANRGPHAMGRRDLGRSRGFDGRDVWAAGLLHSQIGAGRRAVDLGREARRLAAAGLLLSHHPVRRLHRGGDRHLGRGGVGRVLRADRRGHVVRAVCSARPASI